MEPTLSVRADPAAPAGNVTVANLSVTTVLPTYTVLPLGPVPVSFYLNVTNATITPQNVTLWVSVTDIATGVVCENLSLESLVTNVSNLTNLSSRVLNTSFNLTGAALNATSLAKHCPAITSEPVEFVVGAAVDGNVTPIDGTNVTTNSSVTPYVLGGVNTTISTTPGTSLVFTEPTETLDFSSSSALNTYNVSASYSGQYVGRVALTVYSATTVGGSRSVLLSSDLTQVHGATPVVAWYEPHGGVYPYTLQLFTPYDNLTTSGVLVITNATSVYYNTTTQSPVGFGGLSPAASGAVLLVVGLVIGFVVMFAATRWLMGPGAGVAPKQWSGAQGAPAAAGASSTCSFCGRSFGSPEELAAHAKTEHGVE